MLPRYWDSCRGERSVQSWALCVCHGLTSTRLSLPCLVSHSSSECLLKAHENPWATIVSTVFSKPLAIFCRIWTIVCKVVIFFFLFHICFFFSAIEPLNKQWPVATCIKSNKKKVADTCTALKKQFKQFGYEFFCKTIAFFLLACTVRSSFIALSVMPFLLHNKHPSDASQACCVRECWKINECADLFGI